jgi:enamine deaminase RidA (YjgF/YER057c/UK114 family)
LRRSFSPGAIRPPFGRYSHAVSLDAPQKLLVISGQLAVRPDGSVPEDAGEQTAVVLAAIDACLAEAGLGRADVLRLSAYITEPEHREAYMRVRDAWVADPPPASTLLVVKALALPACKVEIEAIAGR